MIQSPCFKALTRPVSFMGLPFTYVVLLGLIVFGGFIGTLSFVYLGLSAVFGYIALRALAAYDPRILDGAFLTRRKTPVPPSYFKGKGIIYRA
jgi:type IV secretion system protein VirB3